MKNFLKINEKGGRLLETREWAIMRRVFPYVICMTLELMYANESKVPIPSILDKMQVPENAPPATPGGTEGREPIEEGQEPKEGAEQEPEEGPEEGAEGVPEEGEDAPLEGRREQGGASQGNNAEDGPEEDEEEEQVSPEVRYVQEEMGKIKEEGKADAAKVARLYKEMKARDANLLLVMSEKFPTML